MKKLIFALSVILMTGCNATAAVQNETLAKSLYAIDQGDNEKAMKYLDELLAESPRNADALYLRAQVNYKEDENSKAIADCTAAIKFHKKRNKYPLSDIYFMRGVIYEYVKENDSALADYNAALKLKKNDVSLLENRAGLYFQMGNYAASDSDFNAVLKIEPANVFAMVGLARNLINQDKHNEAIEILNRTINIEPEYSAPYKFLARAYDAIGDSRKAIDNVILLLTYDDDLQNMYFIREFSPKAYKYTILKLSAAIKEHEDNGMWLYARAMVHQQRKDYRSAISDFQTLNTRFGDSDMIMNHIGYCYSEQEDHTNAIKYYTKAIELDPSDANYYLYRGEAKRKTGHLQAAVEDYTKTIELDPMNSFGYAQRGWAKEMLDDYKGALEDHDMAIEIQDDYAYSYLYRARVYQLLGRDADAHNDFEKIIALDTIPDSNSCRAYALIELGQSEEAVEWAKQVVDKDRDEAGNYYDLACVYARLGRKTEAIDALREAFEHGYRSFGHVIQDDDMDNIRQMPEFEALIHEYKSKPISFEDQEDVSAPETEPMQSCEISMKKRNAGTYEVPCTINDLPLSFIFDTGASTVTISSLEASFMLKNNYLNKSDVLSKEHYLTASGSIEVGTRIRLKNVKIGDFSLDNIEATVVDSQNAPLLLGQSVLNRFGKVDIDYENMIITLER